MRSRNVVAIVALATLSAVSVASASVRRFVLTSYEHTDGERSTPHLSEVGFYTGSELNEKTQRLTYTSFAVYAMIWFDDDQFAVIRLPSAFGHGDKFTADDFKDLFAIRSEVRGEQANSPDPRVWYFRAKKNLEWIDPRVSE